MQPQLLQQWQPSQALLRLISRATFATSQSGGNVATAAVGRGMRLSRCYRYRLDTLLSTHQRSLWHLGIGTLSHNNKNDYRRSLRSFSSWSGRFLNKNRRLYTGSQQSDITIGARASKEIEVKDSTSSQSNAADKGSSSIVPLLTHDRFGTLRHDYTYASHAGPNTSSLTDEQIHALLAERLHAKLGRKFDEADGIRQTLSEAGVYVYDKYKLWRADGIMFDYNRTQTTRFSPQANAGSTMHNGRIDRPSSSDGYRRSRLRLGDYGHDYILSPLAGPSTTLLTEKEIHQLLAQRLTSKVLRDFETADRIKEDLEDQGVYVDDKEKVWRADGVPFVNKRGYLGRTKNFGPLGHDYTLASDAGPNTSHLSDEIIHELLKERLQAKMNRQFNHADRLRDEMELQGVFVDDHRKQWRADNVSFEFVGAVGGYNEEKYEF